MTNIIEFPMRRMEVVIRRDAESGRNLYVFEKVDGQGRQVHAAFTSVQEATAEAACVMAGGCDVIWSEETRRRLFGNGGGVA